jgi:hypothetical protein
VIVLQQFVMLQPTYYDARRDADTNGKAFNFCK